jgi:hypothetical protein
MAEMGVFGLTRIPENLGGFARRRNPRCVKTGGTAARLLSVSALPWRSRQS